MIVLDTNVVSELFRPKPEPVVHRWLAAQSPASIFLTAISEAELRLGIALLPEGKRRDGLSVNLRGVVDEDFDGRILPFDSRSAVQFAEIVSTRRRVGRPISVADAQIAAIARSRGAVIATRNVDDFTGTGIGVINPWSAGRAS